MKHSLKATSIIESVVVLLIVVSGIVWVFNLLNSSQKLADSTNWRIEAIQIARDGLETMTNIRDTNSQLFAADLKNCWNVLNYQSACIWDDTQTFDIQHNTREWLIIFRNINNQFEIAIKNNAWGFSSASYRNNFRVFQDTRWFYTQTGSTVINPLYTREIQIQYLNADDTLWDSNSPKMQVTALVQWSDPASSSSRQLEMSILLTNWRGGK